MPEDLWENGNYFTRKLKILFIYIVAFRDNDLSFERNTSLGIRVNSKSSCSINFAGKNNTDPLTKFPESLLGSQSLLGKMITLTFPNAYVQTWWVKEHKCFVKTQTVQS